MFSPRTASARGVSVRGLRPPEPIRAVPPQAAPVRRPLERQVPTWPVPRQASCGAGGGASFRERTRKGFQRRPQRRTWAFRTQPAVPPGPRSFQNRSYVSSKNKKVSGCRPAGAGGRKIAGRARRSASPKGPAHTGLAGEKAFPVNTEGGQGRKARFSKKFFRRRQMSLRTDRPAARTGKRRSGRAGQSSM